MFLKAFKDELNIKYTIKSDVKKIGYNNKENTIDYAFYLKIIKLSMGYRLKEEPVQYN